MVYLDFSMINFPVQASSLHSSLWPPGAGYEHVDPLLVTLVAGPGLDAVELRGHGAGVVHETQVPGYRQESDYVAT